MGRQPDDRVRTKDPARQRHRSVVLAQVNAIGLRLERQVGTVIEDEWHAVLVAHVRRDPGSSQQWASVEILVAQLDDVDATRQCTP